MANKILIYIGIVLLIGIIIGGIFITANAGNNNINANNIKETGSLNSELEKYRSEDIPEECKLAEYESDVESWKEHLSHHQNTLYCLEYYK